MKTLLLSLAIVFLTAASYSQKKQTDLEFEMLKGKVKSVQNSAMYLGTKDKPEKSPKREYYDIYVYGPDGNINENIDPERGMKYVYQFVDGFLSMKEVVVDKKKAANIMRVRMGGNAENMEKPVKTIKPDERFLTRFDDEYDESGRRRLRRIFFSDGKMDSISLYDYDSSGLLENYIYNSYGNKWSHSYAYDEKGNRKEDLMKRSNAQNVVDMTDQISYSDYKFDAEGNWIERKYTRRGEYNNSSTISEGFEYRDIKYHGGESPKKTTTGKAGKKSRK